MYASVKAQFRSFSERFEGSVPYMYQDVLGLITVGVGNLIDPVSLAAALPFRWKNKPGLANAGLPASQADIQAEWSRVKGDPTLAHRGHLACQGITNLELGDDAIDALIAKQLDGNEAFLVKQPAFAAFETWPADAQLALLSMTWALGPGGPGQFKNMAAGCQNMDFLTAAAECHINEVGNAGVIPRNQANKLLFQNAAAVVSAAMDFSVLYYPAVVGTPAATAGTGQ